jgi:hypothetical protein
MLSPICSFIKADSPLAYVEDLRYFLYKVVSQHANEKRAVLIVKGPHAP